MLAPSATPNPPPWAPETVVEPRRHGIFIAVRPGSGPYDPWGTDLDQIIAIWEGEAWRSLEATPC